jgi:hypothetical protein
MSESYMSKKRKSDPFVKERQGAHDRPEKYEIIDGIRSKEMGNNGRL